MADIAVAHFDMTAKGGAESVAFQTLRALHPHHDITLLTTTWPDFVELNEFYPGQLDPDDITVRQLAPEARLLDSRTPSMLFRLKRALFDRRLGAVQSAYDLLVCTHNEVALEQPAVQYVHYPVMTVLDDGAHGKPVRRVYDSICGKLSGITPDALSNQTVLTNSQWTANIIQRAYDIEPTVVYPPVDGSDFIPQPLSQRERGFVTVGRVTPKKHVRRNIRIIDELRDRGHDVHLHVIGPVPESSYAQTVETLAAARQYVSIEGAVSRARLSELLTTHRYGLHGHEREHFGIVVAEMLAAGMLPFVPDGGGQREVVGGVETVLYDSLDSAVETIDTVMSSPETEQETRRHLPDPTERYAPARFRERMQSVVDKTLSG